jgi:hypothetical protein
VADRSLEEFRVFREKSNARLIAISFRGKKDICLLAKEFGEILDYSEVSYICSRERKRCPYYKRLEEGARYLYNGAWTKMCVQALQESSSRHEYTNLFC